MILKVAKCPSSSLAFLNNVYVAESDLFSEYVVIDGFVFVAAVSKRVKPGFVGLNVEQRNMLRAVFDQELDVKPYDPATSSMLSVVSITVSPFSSKTRDCEIDADGLILHIKETMDKHIISISQRIPIEFNGTRLILQPTSLTHLESVISADTSMKGSSDVIQTRKEEEEEDVKEDYYSMIVNGQISNTTIIHLKKKEGSSIKLKGSAMATGHQATLFDPNFSIEDLGIGGLSDEFKTIFRRVFASRVFPPDMVKKMGVEHVRGMLLYGPPGTGKTLLARQIGKMLHTKEPKVVNGPSILNKYVGQSEENIRELFKDAEEEQAEKGDDSELHLIIFDE
ncbi:Vesicle-fusing ATPase like protein, partial [Aduncisulcus paluster]